MSRPLANSRPAKPATSNAKTAVACRTNSVATTTTTVGTTRTRRAAATTNARPTCGHARIRGIASPSGNFAMAPTTARTGLTKRHAVGELANNSEFKQISASNLCPTLGCQSGCRASPNGGICTCPQGYKLDERFQRTCSGGKH